VGGPLPADLPRAVDVDETTAAAPREPNLGDCAIVTGVELPEQERRLRTVEANFGRDFGWFVEDEGRRIAVLTDPRFEDMFWFSYAVTAIADDAQTVGAIRTPEFWRTAELVFRNRGTGEIAINAYPGAQALTENRDRVWMRGLYVSIQPTAVERLRLWLRSWRRRTGGAYVP
jgi:hypothetical protein